MIYLLSLYIYIYINTYIYIYIYIYIGKVWKDYMERIMNEDSDWDHYVEGDAVEGPVVCVSREEMQ